MHRTRSEGFFQIQFALDSGSDEPLYQQVCQRFKAAILNGSDSRGARVPSIRTLAGELKLSRSTIERAYDLLMGEGFLTSNGHAGTVISSLAPRSPTWQQRSELAEQARSVRNSAGHRSALAFEIGLPAIDAFPQT
ncbi:MAG: aminotransferase class and family protein, partial [Rhizobacter sp.]|nr:aminotransferase class and family protein [Rhizobacter sp.]